MINNRVWQMIAVCILCALHVLPVKADKDHSSIDLYQLKESFLPRPGYSRAEWGFNLGGVEFYLDHTKVIDQANIVIKKLYAETNIDGILGIEGLRVFFDQFRILGDDNKGLLLSGQDIFLGCKDNTQCSETFQIDEDDLLIGFDAFHIHSKGTMPLQTVKITGMPFDWWKPGNTYTGTIKGLKLGGVRKYLDDEWSFENNLWVILARNDVSVDFQATISGSENVFTGLVKINELPLTRVQIVQGKKLDGETDNVLKVALSEINSQESQNNGTKEKANTARIAAIALIQIMFQWLPLQQEQLDVSEFSSFVKTGSSLEIVLPKNDWIENHLQY
ncbi:MAG: hypothetical protein F4073_10780 [Rhodobacteraceae bacterium]|nr:hypothetical protein [Paracoccaceae bacterium]MYI92415.1 hypothetical protein [Paracoccaceae bacterium]